MEHTRHTSYIEENSVSIFIPMEIKKRGGAAMVILPKNVPREEANPNYDQKLINGFAKAFKWQQSLLKNSKLSIQAIAEKEGVTPTYVGRILRLNLVAPDIVADILAGKQPRDLKLQDFMCKVIPELWQEQREMFRFI